MTYNNIKKAKFISRPNRFIANIEVDGNLEVCHVKNTGRCKELLLDNAIIFVEENNSPNRKTKFDLISVYKGNTLINMDSQAPNKVVYEYLQAGKLFENIATIKPEYKYGNSRIDFYVETETAKILIEVKGVTLEENGVAMFPDAPTERGIKHIGELCQGVKDGFDCYIIFVIQMKDVLYFTPNYKTQAAFGEALSQAQKSGVNVLAYDCQVSENSLAILKPVDVKL